MTELCFRHKFVMDLEFRYKFVIDLRRICDRQLLKKFIFIFEINCIIKILKYSKKYNIKEANIDSTTYRNNSYFNKHNRVSFGIYSLTSCFN